jgi:hypothetical protein
MTLVGLFLLIVVVLRFLRALQHRLDGTSSVREYIGIAGAVLQGLAALTAFLVVASLLPERVVALMPWVLLAGALSIGWALRDVGASLISWLILITEGEVKPGIWLHDSDDTMQVLRIGPRMTATRHIDGRHSLIPNQHLVQRTTTFEPSAWPRIKLEVSMPHTLSPMEAQIWLREVFATSPWCAPEPDIHCEHLGETSTWTVWIRALDGDAAMALKARATSIIYSATPPDQCGDAPDPDDVEA